MSKFITPAQSKDSAGVIFILKISPKGLYNKEKIEGEEIEKIIEKYKEECDILSKLASRLWKSGQLFIIIGCLYYGFKTLNYIMAFILPIILGCVLYKICECIEIMDIIKKLKLKYKLKEVLFNSKVRNEVYKFYDAFQKCWITNYCKRNKLNNIEKLKILSEELDKRDTSVKYINPVIIGALSIVIWEAIIQELVSAVGLIYTIIIAMFLVIIISILTGWWNKEWKENKEFFKTFDAFSGKERLQKLLIFRMLKLEK